MQPGFRENATIHGELDPDPISGQIQVLFDWVTANPPASELEEHIASIDIAGPTPVAKVEFVNRGGHHFTDTLNLLEVDGEWRIVCKRFHLHA